LRRIWLAATFVALVVVSGLLVAGYFINEARETAELERQNAEALLSFLLGEKFLGDVRDIGRSVMLEQVRKQTDQRLGPITQLGPLNRGFALRNAGDIERARGELKKSTESFGQALEFIENSPDSPNKRREVARTMSG
jgi:hypothetical protein